jgi:hypothetical protein
MRVDESRSDDLSGNVELALAASDGNAIDRDDAIFFDGNVGLFGGRPGAIDYTPVPYHQIVFRRQRPTPRTVLPIEPTLEREYTNSP